MKLISFGNFFVKENELENIHEHLKDTMDHYAEIRFGMEEENEQTAKLDSYIEFLKTLIESGEK